MMIHQIFVYSNPSDKYRIHIKYFLDLVTSFLVVENYVISRHHTTMKKFRNMKSVSQTKVLDLKVIFKFWSHGQQDWTLFQWLVIIASQNLAVLCVKRPWNLEIWNPFHGQKCSISKWFFNFECTGSKIGLYFNGWLLL